MLFSGVWGGGGKAIHEKTWSKKSRDTVPLSMTYGKCLNVWVTGYSISAFG